MDDRLATVANALLRDGVVDNTPDAYLAAIRILAAAERLDEHPGTEPALAPA